MAARKEKKKVKLKGIKLTRLRALLEEPLFLGKEIKLGTVKPKSFLQLLTEFPGLLTHFFGTDYGKMLEQNPRVITGIAKRELARAIIAEHDLSPQKAALLRKKVNGLKIAKTVWNRFSERVEPAFIEFKERAAELDKGITLFLALGQLKRKLKKQFVETKLYFPEAVEASFEELIELAHWLNEFHGFYPLVLGGWAVFAYYPRYGDIIVELLFPEKQLADDVLSGFYMARDYQAGGLWEKWYWKDVKKNGKKFRVFIIANHLHDLNVLNEDARIDLPWDLAFKDNQVWRIGNIALRVPSREVLLLYKVKALRDKQHDLKHAPATGMRKLILQELIEKDKKDIIALVDFIKPKVKVIKLRKLLEKYGFSRYFSQTLAELNVDLKKDFKV